MPLSNPFRRQSERPALRERAADLRDRLIRSARPAGEAPTPSDLDALALVSAIEAEWSNMAHSGVLEGRNPENDEALDAACDRRDALLDAADALPAETREARHAKALAVAWIEWAELWRPGQPRRATTEERLVFDIQAGMREAPGDAQPTLAQPHIAGLIGLIDFAAASMSDLRSLHDLAAEVGSIAYAMASSGRGEGRRAGPGLGCYFNAAGGLMQWLGDALTDVESAVIAEARKRIPATRHDRGIRLGILAPPTIQNGDPDETEAFALELLAHAVAERARG